MKKIIKGILSIMMLFACIYINTSSQQIDAAEKKIRIACVGDSLTEGALSSQGYKSSTAYPGQLQEMLGQDYEVGNFGKTSYTLMKGTNKSYWNSSEYINSLSFVPDYVIIMLGTNDCKEMYWDEKQYKEDAKALYQQYANLASKPYVYFALSPHVYGNDALITVERINMLHEVQVALIEEMNWDTIDMYTLTADKQYLYHRDGIHFSDDGYRYIAQCMFQKIANGGIDENVDRSNLFHVLDQYQKNYASSLSYTQDSYLLFQEAYENAIKVNRDMNANQQMINDAITTLQSSVNQLIIAEWDIQSSSLINKNAHSNVKVVDYTSQCVLGGYPNEDGEANNLLDYDSTTYWHTDYYNTIGMPQSVTFDLGNHYNLSDITLLPRQGASIQGNGDPIEIKLYGGNQKENLAYLGSYAYLLNGNVLANRNDFVRVHLPSKPYIRYIKYEIVNAGGSDGNRYVNAAEIRFYGTQDTTPPELIDHFTYEVTPTSAQLNWAASPSEDVEKYVIYHSNMQDKYGETSQLSYMIENLTPNTKYDFILKAVDKAGNESLNNPSISFYTSPLLVSGLKAEEIDYKTITLTWGEQPGEVSYEIYVSGQNNQAQYENVTTVYENAYTYTGAMTGKEYRFNVIAKNPMCYGDDHASISAKTSLKGNVNLAIEQVSTAKFKLSWNKVDGATRYIVYRKRNNDKMLKVLTLGSNDTEYVTAEMPHGDYTFQVRAGRYDSKDRVMTAASNKVNGSVEALKPAVSVKAGSKSATVSWKKMEGVTHYIVYRATSGKYTKLITTKELSYTAKSLTSGKKYYFKVRGYKTYKSGTEMKYNVYTPYSSAKTVTAK